MPQAEGSAGHRGLFNVGVDEFGFKGRIDGVNAESLDSAAGRRYGPAG